MYNAQPNSMRTALRTLTLLATLTTVACSSVPQGHGVYMVTVADVTTGQPMEGIDIAASGAGTRTRGGKPALATTDEDGIAVLSFGDWGSIDLLVEAGDGKERWIITQDRIAVNGGKSSVEPLRLIVGAGPLGGSTIYNLSITRVEKGPKLDN